MPKTEEQQKLEGYPSHHKKKATKIPVIKAKDRQIPDPPRWMGRISKRMYHDLVDIVGKEGMKVMAKSDRLALVMVCEAFAEWRECRSTLATEDRYYTSERAGNKTIKRHPAVGDMQNAWTRIMTGLGKFGLTPYERQKVSVIVGDKKKKKTREQEMAERRKKAIKAAQDKNHLQAVNE